jgi:hypothetical protein
MLTNFIILCYDVLNIGEVFLLTLYFNREKVYLGFHARLAGGSVQAVQARRSTVKAVY